MSSSQLIGSVVSLWRYPVKSMMGEELTSAEVTKFGLLGDRAYAVLDVESGKVASAKNPKKWPNLFSFRAAYIESPRVGEEIPPIRITLPDGIMVRSDDADVDATLSRALGREVALSRSTAKPSLEEYWPNIEGLTHKDAVTDEPIPEGTFFDAAVVHVLSTTTIDVLRAAYPEGRFEVRRFRPNIVLQTPSKREDFIENGWADGALAIGSQLCLNVTGPCHPENCGEAQQGRRGGLCVSRQGGQHKKRRLGDFRAGHQRGSSLETAKRDPRSGRSAGGARRALLLRWP